MGVLATASLLALVLSFVQGYRIGYGADESGVEPKQNILAYKPVQVSPYSVNEATEDNAAHSAKIAYQRYDQPLVYDYSKNYNLDGINNADDVFTNADYENAYKLEEEYQDEEQFLKATDGFEHYKTTTNVNMEGPHQIETIETRSFHKKVPEFDISGFKHSDGGHKHGEVHYHQHKHMHKHDHKQDHVHQHKQDHKHEHNSQHKHGHEHKGAHKHDHHDEHKHGHDHKQQHHHNHKEDHKHGHEHHQEHKHNHQHGHKHGHQHGHKGEHKHDHHHAHKHHGDHKHSHHSSHKHDHHGDHKHDHHSSHKHDHHQDHKHDHHHGHKHSHKHGHKHDSHHGHKHQHHSKHH